jgi:hypothetical protein
MYLKIDSGKIKEYFDDQNLFDFIEFYDLSELSVAALSFLRVVNVIEKPTILSLNGKITHIFNPRAPSFDVFLVRNSDDDLIITNDFEYAVNYKGNVSVDAYARKFFLENSVFPPGKTIFGEILRLKPGVVIHGERLNYSDLIEDSDISKSCNENKYEEFSLKFEAYIKSKVHDKDVAVLLSGGLDSTAVLVAAKKYAKSVTAFTMEYDPPMRGVEKDFATAKKTALDLGLTLKSAHINFFSVPNTKYEEYIRRMPMAAGLISGFDALMQKIDDDGISTALTGQNADWLYWLSATSAFNMSRGGFAAFFRRIFLNKEYFNHVLMKTKKINNQSTLANIAFTLIEWTGAILYSIFKKKIFIPPNSINQLLFAFERRADVMVFIEFDELNNVGDGVEECATSFEVYKSLLRIVIQKNMMLPDSQIIRRAGDLRNIETIFPYSCEHLMDFWMNKQPSIKEVFTHKKLIKQYVSKNYPKYFQKVNNWKKYNIKALSEHAWAKEVLDRNLHFKKIAEKYPSNEGITPYRRLVNSVSGYWLESIIGKYSKFLKNKSESELI